ncbi:MAG: Formamidopyrimidine-DNA glycosylase [Chlamydiae bacterium]|nr:Formamidopyrimidine-DNA glycosylase [Chlamydiota bacterium]
MPELPEVETIKDQLLDANLLNQVIEDVHFYWRNTLANSSIEDFNQSVIGQCIHTILRRGKYLIFRLKQQDLIVHLRMSGQFSIKKQKPDGHTHERAYMKLAGKYLVFHDVRKFGRWQLVDDYKKHLAHLGVEPLSPTFKFKGFSEKLKKTSKAIKPALLDQRFIAGIGNIYADESLWQAFVHPKRSCQTIKPKEARQLFIAIKDVLKKAVKDNGSSLGSGQSNFKGLDEIHGKYQYNFNVYQRHRLPCLNCKKPIDKIKFHQRGTHFCSFCQK